MPTEEPEIALARLERAEKAYADAVERKDRVLIILSRAQRDHLQARYDRIVDAWAFPGTRI